MVHLTMIQDIIYNIIFIPQNITPLDHGFDTPFDHGFDTPLDPGFDTPLDLDPGTRSNGPRFQVKWTTKTKV